jgi:hypothetical protein
LSGCLPLPSPPSREHAELSQQMGVSHIGTGSPTHIGDYKRTRAANAHNLPKFIVMSFYQSLDDLLSAQDADDRDYHSDTEPEQRPASTPPHAHSAAVAHARHAPHRQDIDLDEQVVPSLRSQDLAGRIRSYQGLLWRRNAKGRTSRGWSRAWFKVAPGRAARMLIAIVCMENFVLMYMCWESSIRSSRDKETFYTLILVALS